MNRRPPQPWEPVRVNEVSPQVRIKRQRVCARITWLGWLLIIVPVWLFATATVITLQIDKSRMTILKEDELRKLFFPSVDQVANASIVESSEEQAKRARKSASIIYRWLVPGSPKALLPWNQVIDDALLNASASPGHCGPSELALLAQGKIDTTNCGNWARPHSDGCAGGFIEQIHYNVSIKNKDCVHTPKATAPPAGSFAPEGFTCYVACLLGASCGVSKFNNYKCIWSVTLKHTDDRPYLADSATPVCPGVAYEILCPNGFVCRTPAATPELCPKGHYCPRGSFQPLRCPFFASCSQPGLDAPNVHQAAAAALLGFFGLILFLLQTSRFVRHQLRRFRENLKEKRLALREQFLERRAQRLAHRLGFGLGFDDDASAHDISSLGRQFSITEEEEDAQQIGSRSFFCGTTLLTSASFSDDEDDEDTTNNSTNYIRSTALELPPSEYSISSQRQPNASSLRRQAPDKDSLLLRHFPTKLPSEQVSIDFRDLGLSVTAIATGRAIRILDNVSGSIRSGSVCAIMGPSGGGKSSLLKVLSCRLLRGTDILTPETRIFVNGNEHIPLRQIASLTAFAPQDDVMCHELTVLEILEFSASCRLPTSNFPTRNYRKRLVRNVANALGLRAVRHSVVGSVEKRGISGGQKKRVNLGMEIVADPCVLLADEPTSGLDAANSLEIVRVFKKLASKGVAVAAVLHQPAYQLYMSFSDVLLLAPGGRTAYHGPPGNAARYFEQQLGFKVPQGWSPPDFFMQILVKQPQQIALAWDALASKYVTIREYGQDTAAGITLAAANRAPPSWLSQLILQTSRSFLRQRRVAGSIAGDIVIQTLIGGGIGLLYVDYSFHNAQLVNFMVSIGLGFTLTLAGTPTFTTNRDVVLRECCSAAGGGLSVSAYFMANFITDAIRFAALSTVFVLGFYPLAHPRASLGFYVLAALADGFAASGFGYIAGCLFDESGSLLAALCLALIFALFSGVHPTINQMPTAMRVVNYISHDRYFVEVLFVEEVIQMSEAFRMPPSFYSSSSDSVLAQLLAYGYFVSDFSIYWNNHFLRWLDLATLVSIGLAARVAAYLIYINLNAAALGRESISTTLRNCCVDLYHRLFRSTYLSTVSNPSIRPNPAVTDRNRNENNWPSSAATQPLV